MATQKSLIMGGFKEDCEALIARFEQASDIRFQTFSEIWKEMKFSLIFTGRQSVLELLEFCEEALHTCKQFVLLQSRFKERIGGLYLLYGVYYKMPVDQFKIRIKLEDWKSIMELHSDIKEAEHLDANYVLCKLIADNAFHFCIFDKEFGLEKQFRTKERQCLNPYSVLPSMKDLTDEHPVLTDLKELSKSYNDSKLSLVAKTKSSTSLNLYNANFADEIISDIRAFEEKRRNQQVADDHDPSTSREDKNTNCQKNTKRKVRSRLGDGFNTDSYDSGEESESRLDDFDPNLPDCFD